MVFFFLTRDSHGIDSLNCTLGRLASSGGLAGLVTDGCYS